jgi:hypothetical protein
LSIRCGAGLAGSINASGQIVGNAERGFLATVVNAPAHNGNSGTLVTDPLTGGSTTGVPSLALLGQYAAFKLRQGGDGHGGTMITDPPPNQQPLLAQPHA